MLLVCFCVGGGAALVGQYPREAGLCELCHDGKNGHPHQGYSVAE